jgi:heat shock protein HslJ
MKHTWMSRVAFIAAALIVVALLGACTITLPGAPSGPATKAPSPMPPAGKQAPIPTKAPAAAPTLAPTGSPTTAPAAAPAVATKAVVTGTASTAVTTPLEGTLWKMVSYLDSQGQTHQALPEAEVTTRFQESQVSGSDGCNQFGGSYKTEGSVLTIKLGPSTMMACDLKIMQQAQGYTAALASSATYQIKDGELQLTNGGGKIAVTFSVLDSKPLVGTTWKAQSYNNGKGAVVSLANGTEITALFAADGTLSGFAGCNNYSTTYQAITSTLKISPTIATTKKICPEPVMQQETAYLASLPTAATFKIQSNRLELRDARGAMIANYTAPAPAPAAGQAPAVAATKAPTGTVTITSTAAAGLPLEGTNWKLASLLSARGGAFPPLPGTDITGLFQGGRLIGSAGCNNYAARFTLSGDKLTIAAPAATTRKACAQPIMQQEAAYLAALKGIASFKIDGDKLELRNAAGALVASYTAPTPAAPTTAAPAAPAATKAPAATAAPTAAPTKAPTATAAPTKAPAATTAPAQAAAQLTDTLWKWVRFVSPVEAQDVPAPDKYAVVFRKDGKLEITADCNKAAGTYKTVGSRIQIQLGPSTLAACPADSWGDDFLKYLDGAALYFTDDGNLFIELFADSGVLKFANGGPAK